MGKRGVSDLAGRTIAFVYPPTPERRVLCHERDRQLDQLLANLLRRDNGITPTRALGSRRPHPAH